MDATEALLQSCQTELETTTGVVLDVVVQSCQCVLDTTTGVVLGVVGTAGEELQSCQWVADDEGMTGFEEVVVGFGLLEVLLQSCH